MKKILVLVSILLVVFSFRINEVSAKEVNVEVKDVDNLYSFHYRNNVLYSFGKVHYRFIDGNIAYCVEPGVGIYTNTYYETEDFSITGYSEDVKKEMELISYYGYGYRGHDSVNYYLATQELIWLYSQDDYITFNKGWDEVDEKIDLTKEKEEILKLVRNHNKKPSFYNEENMTDSGVIKLVDNNNVLDMYDIEYDNSIKVEKNGNELIVSSDTIGEYEIRFKKIRSSFDKTILYVNNNYWTQKMAIFKEPIIDDFVVRVRFDKVNVKIIKKDLDTNEIINDKGNKVKILDINSNNYLDNTYEFINGEISLLLREGKYKIEEVDSSYGYTINKEGLEFVINKNDNINKEVVFNNKRIKGKVNIIKKDEDGNYLNGVKFNIYDDKMNIVDEVITDDKNNYSKELPLGNYKIEEVKTLYGYEKDNKIYDISLSENNKKDSVTYNNIELVNKKIKCDIVVITSSNGKSIDSGFEVYDLSGNLVYSGKTKDGKSSFYLEYGDYILKEISVPNGYKLNNEEIEFSVNDITCESHFNINNEEVIMPITSTTYTSSLYFGLISIIEMVLYGIYKKIN